MIELEGISYGYGEGSGEALRDVAFSLRRGEALALIGPNGCGKSTLLKLLNGLLLPFSGSYRFDGETIDDKRLKDTRFAKAFHQKMGFLFQNSDAQLFCPSVYEEVAFGPSQLGLSEGEIETRVADCLKLMGIESLRDRVPYHLSEGEKRRVAFASVLSMNPEAIALDEPMNGLDPRMKAFIRELIIELKRSGKTILCATHDFRYVEGAFDKALALSGDHRVARIGPYEELIGDEEFLKAENIV